MADNEHHTSDEAPSSSSASTATISQPIATTITNTSSKSQNTETSLKSRIWSFITYVPPRCRYRPPKDPEDKHFPLSLNILFAFAATFSVANLYYSHPILATLAKDFDVSNETAARVPTIAQAGYASGLLLLCPMGDLLRRRPFVILVMLCTATVWIGLCITKDFNTFLGLTFITGMTTVTPQLMLPLVGDLAPLHRRATALSIVGSGLILGMLIARFLSGVVANYTSWRNVYWLACGAQYILIFLLWLFMPDYPPTNPDMHLTSYFSILFSILGMIRKHAVLVQCCIISLFASATFTSFWTTLTFLLVSPRYAIAEVYIGLFGLAVAFALLSGPLFSRLYIDKHAPLASTIIGLSVMLLALLIGTYTGLYTLAGPILQAILQDAGLQIQQVANRTAIYSVEPKGRNRVNTAYMLFVFCGQLMGTAVGNRLYAQGGWILSGSVSVGFVGAALVVAFARGPWEEGWIGWGGGWSLKRDLTPKVKSDVEAGSGGATALKGGGERGQKEGGQTQPDLDTKNTNTLTEKQETDQIEQQRGTGETLEEKSENSLLAKNEKKEVK